MPTQYSPTLSATPQASAEQTMSRTLAATPDARETHVSARQRRRQSEKGEPAAHDPHAVSAARARRVRSPCGGRCHTHVSAATATTATQRAVRTLEDTITRATAQSAPAVRTLTPPSHCLLPTMEAITALSAASDEATHVGGER